MNESSALEKHSEKSEIILKPDIFTYLDPKEYLRDMLEFLRRSRLYSTRKFARAIGIRGNNYLKIVVDGKRKLTLELVSKLSSGLTLSKEESDYFAGLVLYHRASHPAEKALHLRLLSKMRAKESHFDFEDLAIEIPFDITRDQIAELQDRIRQWVSDTNSSDPRGPRVNGGYRLHIQVNPIFKIRSDP